MNKDLIRTPIDALVYYTECALASYSLAVSTKKYSKADIRRLGNIARGMVEELSRFDADGAEVYRLYSEVLSLDQEVRQRSIADE